ncbi:MAG: hypothetical protein WAN35_19080 [Terracidiphilus sp.]
MPDEKAPLLERVASYYTQLSTVAADLNAVSDELGKSIAEIDLALKKLNLGITTWVTIYCGEGEPRLNDDTFWSQDLGYAKVAGKWGISLRTVAGEHYSTSPDKIEEWQFNDAPRWLRLQAIDKIPDLLEKLSKDADKTTKAIRARLSETQAVAEAVKGAANRPARVQLQMPIRPLTRKVIDAKEAVVKTDFSLVVPSLDAIRHAVGCTLVEAGHTYAAQLLGMGSWIIDGETIRIEVAGMGKKMLALTVNAAVEKIIRQELQRIGAPSRFLVVPGEGINVSALPSSALNPSIGDSTEVK